MLLKFYGEVYKDQALDVYGLDYPKVKHLLPNNFPLIKVDERRSDTVFLLEDNSILLLEYETNHTILENQLKYCDYVLRIVNRYYREERKIVRVHVAVIYSSNITEASSTLEMGGLLLTTKSVFLKQFDGDRIYRDIEHKIRTGIPLDKQDIMKLILTPLMNSIEKRQMMIYRSIELAKLVDKKDEQVAIIAGILTVTDKIIDEEYSNKVREWLRMTQVDKIYQREKEEAVEQAKKEQAYQFAKSILDVLPVEEVSKRTGLSIDEVKSLVEHP